MKLKITEQGLLKAAQSQKETQSRRGRTSKNKGSKFERDVAKQLRTAYNTEFIRTPMSGGFNKSGVKSDQFRGDIVPASDDTDCILHIEVKCQKTWKLSEWLRQSQADCPKGKYPCVIFHQHGTSNNFITMSLQDFLNLVPEQNIITKLREVIS